MCRSRVQVSSSQSGPAHDQTFLSPTPCMPSAPVRPPLQLLYQLGDLPCGVTLVRAERTYMHTHFLPGQREPTGILPAPPEPRHPRCQSSHVSKTRSYDVVESSLATTLYPPFSLTWLSGVFPAVFSQARRLSSITLLKLPLVPSTRFLYSFPHTLASFPPEYLPELAWRELAASYSTTSPSRHLVPVVLTVLPHPLYPSHQLI